ncbi:hypothetical protein PFISCL1PPCAC_14797 [Pristionchus fissidentatus]|uniref:Uncharacterized protein n=1 Tax=Pristionchus fissidentatus TaxID=1538716 RepID=A0AAV5VYE1_9BILA|nr:hypothetical protein PFISCL1PPCAC_14797 [Pristionchus fissidentatus]
MLSAEDERGGISLSSHNGNGLKGDDKMKSYNGDHPDATTPYAIEVITLREINASLEVRVSSLERDLRLERDNSRRREADLNVEHDRESNESERRWMEQMRTLREERDRLQGDLLLLEEQLESAAAEVNRAVSFRLETEEGRIRVEQQYENLCTDYDETMQERSTVLEENARLSEERDKLRVSVKQLSTALHARQNEEAEQIRNLNAKLEATKRMFTHGISDNAKHEFRELRKVLQQVTMERDEALRSLADSRSSSRVERSASFSEEAAAVIVDHWSTHSFSVMLHSKGNLGVVLEGGSADSGRRHLPIYVKEVLSGSPLETHLRRLDHIVQVNDIDVAEMDVRSVIDILRNSQNLKMVIRRRTSLHRVVQLPVKNDLGLELATGVFVNRLDKGGNAEKAGIHLGNRLIYVNGTPVFDSMHAEELIRKEAPHGSATLSFLNGAQRNPSVVGLNGSGSVSKHKTLFSKLFRRNGAPAPPCPSSPINERSNVVARANIDDRRSGGDYFVRHGSLRLPSHSSVPQHFVRAGSLRAPQGSVDHNKIIDSLDRYLQGHSANRASPLTSSADNGSTWPKSLDGSTTESAVMRRRSGQRPSVFPVFAAPPPPPLETASDRHCSCSSPSPWGDNPPHRDYSPAPSSVTSHPMSTYSPSLPQPPPYPGPRYGDESMSSIVSSTNSVPRSATSTFNRLRHQPNNSPSESEAEVRRVCLRKEQSDYAPEFGVGLEDGTEGGVYVAHVHERAATHGVNKGDRVLDIGGINMRSADKSAAARVLSQFHASQDEVTLTVSTRGSVPSAPFWVTVPRSKVRLCGGNAIGILSDTSVGDLIAGDCILELDGFDLRKSTLEEATSALHNGHSETLDILAQRGGGGMDKLRSGADGDGFYVRVNTDRIGETNDELDVKQGEIVFVDNTLFMGAHGRWRAWKIDREGRQRQCGIIPSATVVETSAVRRKIRMHSSSRPHSSLCRPVYERVERISTQQPRPVLLFGAIVSPFIQALLDDPINKFSPCVPECRALSQSELDRLILSGQILDARRRDKLYDVIAVAAVQSVMDLGMHVVLDVSPSALHQLHLLRVYPIVIRIKFKSPKQIKELKEELGEKLTSKQAKEIFDKAAIVDNQLESTDCSLVTVPIGVQTPMKNLVKHVCQQIVAHVEHEQKKSVWVSAL